MSPPPDRPGGPDPLDRFVVILHEPRDLVNIALVVRAMKNMGLGRLRLVSPAEFDPYRIEGIAHGTEDLVERAEVFGALSEAVQGAAWVVGTSARRRSSRQRWWGPGRAAEELLERSRRGDVALLFGREDRGLSNDDLDLCHAVITIPASPDHPSLNLAHAALLVFWELRKAAVGVAELERREMAPKKRRRTPPATAEEMEELFRVWEEALEETGFFHGIDPGPKMRSFRGVLQRAELDRRELGLLEAAAYEVLHYTHRERARVRSEVEGGRPDDAIGRGRDDVERRG